MQRFASRMNSNGGRGGGSGGARGGRGGRGAGSGGGGGGGGGYQRGGYYNNNNSKAAASEETAALVGESFNAATSGFFQDLDQNGRYRQFAQDQLSRVHQRSGGQDDGDLVDDQTLTTVNRNGDATSGKQTQDAVLWIELGLCKALTRAVTHLGFLSPTPVQTQAIPAIMGGSDCCVRAVTGSGKTAAFVLPILHRILTASPSKQTAMSSKRKYIRGLILVPSRELGVQCHEMTKQFMSFTTEVRVALAIGGVSAQVQEAALEQSPELVIATPGRFVDILHNYKGPHGGIDMSGVEMVCLDECDKMLTITLKDQVADILERIPPETRQMLLFSATMTSEVDEFAKQNLFEPKNVDVGHVALASQLRQQFIRIKIDQSIIAAATAAKPEGEHDNGDEEAPSSRPVKSKSKRRVQPQEEENMDSASDDDETAAKKKRIRSKRMRDEKNSDAIKEAEVQRDEEQLLGPMVQEHVTKIKTRYLVALCEQYFKKAVIIFTKYRTTAHRLHKVFQVLGLKSAELQGNQLQEERFEALRQFSSGDVTYLFCTDVASRGLDIKGIATVINFDLPPTLTAYIHRVGRTARIGEAGTAASLEKKKDVTYLFCTDVASRGLDIKGIATVINFDLPPTLTAYIHRVGRTARIGEAGTAASLVHETLDADIMRKILTVSGNINQHQVASVKRRDVPDAILQDAMERINAAFPRVKEILAAENLAEKVALAEKLLNKERSDPRATYALSDAIAPKAKRQWCLSKKERKERDEAARKKYESEAEVTINEAQQELAEIGKEEGKFLQKQKNERKMVREKKQRVRDRELEKIKADKKKHGQKVQAGNVKQLKKQKIREARKAKRAENREKKGHTPYKRREKKSKTKSRHAKKAKKH
ncbi:ATP-dependent DEAD/DEAH box RNA helicase, putative [Bodo saltans]|uniref:ATP-dependent DEAD/DEAH box RNA helicase, putative n=1 Tax=Bodo saltans TaxID=75058 RepID=A0A0S4II81_BODSA|nr:ATP-dependent DEAD/DEAH box RNA helicase, putative [Bodo saltans]|eukprot:CUE71040.1 ATP-dependent DEAD/DEAH box RNA helicase, putative [Bodo saltans]